jgi:hypothetical protein
MKKLLFLFSILLIVITESNTCNHNKQKSPLSATKPITLNGVDSAKADSMVSYYIKDHISSDSKTAIWLSRKWVDTVDSLLAAEHGDGFRIYFAKRNDNLRNTIVIVSTTYDGENAKAESKKDHLDYFTHNSSFLNSADAKIEEDWYGKPGAELFDPAFVCPGETCTTASINYITCSDADTAVQNFLKPNQSINTDSEWFPISLLDKLREELDKGATNTSSPSDGIRIYFAKNPNNQKDPKHKNRNTLIITTTQLFNKTHRDYFYCSTAKQVSKNIVTDDHGEECPNNCNGVTLP